MKKTVLMLSLAMFIFMGQAFSQAGGRPPQGERGERPQPEEILKKMDTNNDGQISKGEAKGPLAQDFEAIDADKNGFITLAELKAKKGDKPPHPPKDGDDKKAKKNKAKKDKKAKKEDKDEDEENDSNS